MTKIVNGDVHTYIQQLITETLGFEEGHGRIFENSRNHPQKEGRQDDAGSLQNADNQRSEK